MSRARAKPAPPAPGAALFDETLPEEQVVERAMLAEEARMLLSAIVAERGGLTKTNADREKLNVMWAAAKQDLEAKRSELREKQRRAKEVDIAAEAELRMHKSKLKALLSENNYSEAGLRIENLTALRLVQESFAEDERDLRTDHRDLQVLLKEMENSHDEYVNTLNLEHDRAITAMRLDWERQTRELQAIYEDILSTVREKMNTERENEVADIEKSKNEYIASLLESHEKAFADIKLYFNEITHSNLDLIKSLKEELADLAVREADDERLLHSIASENKKVALPMAKAIEDVKQLKKERAVYFEEVKELQAEKAKISQAVEQLEQYNWEQEIIAQRYAKLKSERDALYEKLQNALHELQQKAGFKQLLLEQRLVAAANEVEKNNLCLAEVLRSANIASDHTHGLQSQLDDILHDKDEEIHALRNTVISLAHDHDSLLIEVQKILEECGVSKADLGFAPADSAAVLRSVLGPQAFESIQANAPNAFETGAAIAMSENTMHASETGEVTPVATVTGVTAAATRLNLNLTATHAPTQAALAKQQTVTNAALATVLNAQQSGLLPTKKKTINRQSNISAIGQRNEARRANTTTTTI